MNLAFVYPPLLRAGRGPDFTNIMGSPRGTTGSEIQILALAWEMRKRGHNVTLYIEQPNSLYYRLDASAPCSVDVQELKTDLPFDVVNSKVDAVIVSLDPTLLKFGMPKNPLRVVLQQINGFEWCPPDFADHVDLFVSPSQPHIDNLQKGWKTPLEKWAVLPNGCYLPERRAKVSGRCIYASSPDRGLHHLATAWPEIKEAVPCAELRVFYYALANWLATAPTWNRVHAERAALVERLLKMPGVTVVGGVSRDRMALEMSEAECLLYPCDTIDWTEGFSCSTLEGCAAGALPILMDTDALGHIYGGSVPMADRGDVEGWTALAIRALTVPQWADVWRARARAFAEKTTWPIVAERFEGMLKERLAR